MRFALIATLLLLVTAAVASSAQSPFPMLEVVDGAVVVTGPDSTDSLAVTPRGVSPAHPSWSPDGTQIALIEAPYGSPSDSDVWIAPRPVGGATDRGRQLTFSGGVDGGPVWSPDGMSIAYVRTVPGQSDVWVIPAAGGTTHRVTSIGSPKRDLSWAPVGSKLVYSEDGTYVEVTDAVTGVSRLLAEGGHPVWSPDGSQIAFVNAADHVAVMRADGTARHELTTMKSMSPGPPAWSPDGSSVIFAAWKPMPRKDSVGTGAIWASPAIWRAPADASSAPRALTGPFYDQSFASTYPSYPSYSPDGKEIYYRDSGNVLWRMNADGSCQRPAPPLPPQVKPLIVEGPYWAPGSSGGRVVSCVDVQAFASDPQTVAGVGVASPVLITIENHGSSPAPNVVVHADAAAGLTFTGCDLVEGCALGDLAPGSFGGFVVNATFSGAGTRTLTITASSTAPNVTVADPATVSLRVYACSVNGTSHRDRLVGTTHSEGICGRDGNDRIEGRSNGDYLNGGSGNDVIVGGLGRDTILGGSGNDTIYAHDGISDWINCGSGNDVANVDRYDTVVNCERVRRK